MDGSLVMNLENYEIRNDSGGSGYFGASRVKNIKGIKTRYKHEGVDYLVTPGMEIYSPVTGRIKRLAYPYADKSYEGIVLEAKRLSLKIFYIKVHQELVGRIVQLGQNIGIAQDISKRYPEYNIKPHIHVQVIKCDPEILIARRNPNG